MSEVEIGVKVEVGVIVMKDAVSVLIGKPVSGPDAGKWVIPSDFVHDHETIFSATERTLREKAGLAVIPKQVLFVSEIVEPDEPHRFAIFAFAECGSSGDPAPDESYSELRFVDPRDLSKYQGEGMAKLSESAFYKFSLILQNQAQAQMAQRSGTL